MVLLVPQFWPFEHNSEIADCPRGRGGFCLKRESTRENWGVQWVPRRTMVTSGSHGSTALPSPLQHLPSDLWHLICCCQLPLICEQAGMSLGERAGKGEGDAWKEGFIPPPAPRGWMCNLPLEFCNFYLAWSSGGKKNCKLMTAVKQALEEVWGCWGFFELPAGRNPKEGEGMKKEQFVSLAKWWLKCVKGALHDRTIQEPFFSPKLKNKFENNFLLTDNLFEVCMLCIWVGPHWPCKHCSVKLLRRGPAHFLGCLKDS